MIGNHLDLLILGLIGYHTGLFFGNFNCRSSVIIIVAHQTIGFSSSPGLIRVFGIIPGLGMIVFSVASMWMLVAMIIAVRQALDYKSTLRAVGVCVIGWIIQILIFAFLFGMLSGPKPA